MLGFLLGVGCILAAINWEGGALSAFYRPPILMLVLGGSLGATLTSHSLTGFLRALRQYSRIRRLDQRQSEALVRLSRYAGIVRYQGPLALEKEAKSEPEPVLAQALSALADGAPIQEIEALTEALLSAQLREIQAAERFYETMGGACPTFGLIGTVVGLVSMMLGMKSPDTMAQGMASSFVATFYGMILANVLFLPLASRVRESVKEYERFSNNLLLGIRLVQAGSPPRSLLERLNQPMGVTLVSSPKDAEVKACSAHANATKTKGRESGTGLKRRFASRLF